MRERERERESDREGETERERQRGRGGQRKGDATEGSPVSKIMHASRSWRSEE